MSERSDLSGMTLQLDHKYRVGAVVYRGSMATTYKGMWELLDLPVHIRSYESLIKLRLRHRDTTRVRWSIETEAGKIRGPHLPDVIDAGVEDPTRPFLIMRLGEGDLLLNRLRSSGRLDAPEVVRIVEAVAKALTRCRELGILHRGPTADRVWLSDDGEITLLGVGEVLYRDDTVSMAAPPTTELLWHIPPESFTVSLRRTDTTDEESPTLRLRTRPAGTLQGRTLEDDPRAEVYALGCLAYHALNGHHPFFTALDDPTEGIHATIRDSPLPLRDHDANGDVWRTIATAIARDPADRFATVEELATRLRQAVESEAGPPRRLVEDDRTGAPPAITPLVRDTYTTGEAISVGPVSTAADPVQLWAWRIACAALSCLVVVLLLGQRFSGSTVLITSVPSGITLGEEVGHTRDVLGPTPVLLHGRHVTEPLRLFAIGPDGAYGETSEYNVADFQDLGRCRSAELELRYPEAAATP
ncbi:MAG: hypothetical protein H6697_00490 [Myxococcales bacterium]|nr:hypothetical protein [Myxococcales bacterium]MCB9520013.1 hypothetical protein [Myxococcales bacterium]